MPATENFSMPAGDTMELTFTVESEDDDFDLTDNGVEVRWWFAPSVWYGVDQASGKKDNAMAGGLVVVDATHFTVLLQPADTDALHGEYYHEAEVEIPGGGTFTVTTGKMTITRTLVR